MRFIGEQPLFVEGHIRTFTGIYFDLTNPTKEMIDIVDIAHALSNQCRFAGHLPIFYSVAQHSVLCADMLMQQAPEHALAGLLHDASEAYLLDIPSPIKPLLHGYYEIENSIMNLIAEKYGFEYPKSEEVENVDLHMLYSEWHNIKLPKQNDFEIWTPTQAKEKFLETYNILSNKSLEI